MIFDYVLEYDAFQNSFKKTEISGEEVGEMVMKMAGHFARYNMRLGDALRTASKVKADFQNQVDPSTGKAMSSAKAEILSATTAEVAAYEMARIHVQNIQEMINALKCLQRGVLYEYANSA